MPSELRKQRDRERRERTRESLLEAAAHVFAHKGYHNTLVSDVVAEAGVGQGTFYRYFETKRQVLEEMLDKLVEALVDAFAGMSAELPRNVEEYREASVVSVVKMAETMAANRNILLLFLRGGLSIDPDFADRVEEVKEQFEGLARLYLEYAIANGFARPCDVTVVSQSLVGIGLRQIDLWLSGKMAGGSFEDVIREVVDLAFLGIRPAETAEGAKR